MPDYSKSIIYTIRSRDSVYVGSTIDFRSRKYQHKCCIYNEKNKNYNVKLYKTIRENDGEWDMQPYSKYPCKDILELTIEEERIRQLLKADMNIKNCGTGIEYGTTEKEYMKQYNDINKVKIKKVKKQYYQKNKDKLNENMKQYREQHKDEIKKYFQNMSVEKKNQRNEKKIEKVICECGCVVSSRNMSRHRKSKKHLKLIQSLEV